MQLLLPTLLLITARLSVSSSRDVATTTKQTPNTTFDNNEISKTFELLKEGEEKIVLSEQHKNIILVLGNTGAGKTTFIQWIAGDNSKLISKEVAASSGEFIIADGNRIGTSTIKSQTIFPELVVDNKTHSAYYDCPGFSDTRSTSHDIASTYFIKNLTDYVTSVKIVLVVGHHSVKKGVSRNDFILLLEHITGFIKNIGKFKNSIAMMVTKVNNQYVKKGRMLTLVSDETVKLSIAYFLQEVKHDLGNELKNVKIPHKKHVFCKTAINLVDMLLENNEGNYTRIGIFRRPDEPGPISDIPLLLDGKEDVEKILYDELKFTEKDNNDFGYTISDRSKNDINILVETINDKVWLDISKIVYKVQDHYKNLIERTRLKINSFVNNTKIVHARESEARAISHKIYTGCHIINQLSTDSNNLTTVEDLAKKIKSSIPRLGIDTCTDHIKNIEDQGKFLNFLQVVSDRKLNTRPWSSLFQKLEMYLSNAKTTIEEDVYKSAKKINNSINGYAENIAKEIEARFIEETNMVDIEKLPIELSKRSRVISQLKEEISNLSSPQELSEKISDCIMKSDFCASPKIGSDTINILHNGKYLEFLEILSNVALLDTWSSEWMIPFNNTSRHVTESESWYTFLYDLYVKLSGNEIQKYKNDYINDWGQIGKNNFKMFLEKIKKFDITGYDDIENLEVADQQLDELNHVLGLTLRNKIDHLCTEEGRLIIKGDYIKFSDFINDDGKIEVSFCYRWVPRWHPMRDKVIHSVDVFALDTVIIDRDFNGKGSKLKFSIVAPKWVIDGTRKINLDGYNGMPHYRSKAYTGNDGMPGMPGGPAGNLFGIANEIFNGNSLTITANGGSGGPGQDGGVGDNGRNGQNATTDDSVFKSDYIDQAKLITVFYNQVDQKYKFFGKPGSNGGKGGDGGIGGYGGLKGRIKIIKLVESFNSPYIGDTLQGYKGLDGKGGRGGLGGKHGNDLLAYYCKKFVLFIPFQLNWCDKKVIPSNVFAVNGPNGRDGYEYGHVVDRNEYTGLNWQYEKLSPEPEVYFQNVVDILNDYKIFLRENLSDRFRKHSLMHFVSRLDRNADVTDSYDTLALVNEFQGLEKQVHSLHKLNKNDLIYFYQSIINRASEYARKSAKNNENFTEHKKVLGHLQTSALSRIHNLRDDSYPNLIINIDQNLDLVKQDLENLRNIQGKNNKANLVNQYKDKYKSAINTKISEYESFIADQILPEINNVHVEIGNRIALLVNETIILQQQTKEEIEVLMQKKEELEYMFTASSIFDGLKFFGQIIGCFANLGSVVGSVTELESLVALGEDLGTTLKLPGRVISDIQSVRSELTTLKDQKTLNSSTDFYSKYISDRKNSKTVDKAIEQAKEKIEKLEQYKSQIQETIMPVLENMVNDLELTAGHLNKKSKVSVEITKWQVQRALKNMKLQIRQYTKGLNTDDSLASCIENLEDVMTTLISVYDCIQDYQYQKQLADYLAQIVYPTDNNIDIKDTELKKALRDLEIITKSNLVLRRYKIAVEALKQQVFPLAHLYLEESMLPSHLELEDNFQNLIDKATKKVETIQSKIKEYKTSITQHDQYMNSGWFNSEYESSKPFFVWRNERHRDMISNLLFGKKVVVMPNILNSPFDKDAIKFNMIGIHLYSSNLSTSLEIQNKLKRVKVSLTHLGNSYYRFNGNVYVITSGSQNIQYSFERDSHGDPVHKNNVYNKMKSGDLILSPYAMWEIQLIHPEGKIPNHFWFEPEMYKQPIDLELIGRGGYLAKGYNISNLDLENNYKENEVLFPVSYIDEVESQMGDETRVEDFL